MDNYIASPYAELPDAFSLVEVVDTFNRPLCLMSVEEAKRQALYFRKSALLASDRMGRFLLGQDRLGQIGFTFFSWLPAGKSHAENCLDWLEDHFGRLFTEPELEGVWPPCPENGQAFTGICKLRLSFAIIESIAGSDSSYLVVEPSAPRALIEGDYPVSPFFRLVYESGWLHKAEKGRQAP